MTESVSSSKVELCYEDVTGPVLYSHPLKKKIGTLYSNEVIRFFIPIEFFKSTTELHPANMFGTNVYPITSPLPAVCVHQGIIIKTASRPEEVFELARTMNIFDDGLNLTRKERFVIKNLPTSKLQGLDILVKITDVQNRWEGSRQFDVRTKSSNNLTANGLIILFGQPVFGQVETFDMDLLLTLKQLPPEAFLDDRNWYRFSLTGEPATAYQISDFCDDGLPFRKWVSQRMKKTSLYFDTCKDRYEIAMMVCNDGICLKVSVLTEPMMSVAQIRSEGSPVKQSNKRIISEQVEWENVVWEETGVKINGQFIGPILSYFWVKRKRILQ